MKIIESEQSILIKDFNKFEKKFNLVIPRNFKMLYLKYNGGIEESGNEIVNQLFSLNYGENSLESVRTLMQITEDNIAKEYLIFANDGVGNHIAINVDKYSDGYAEIFLFRHGDLEPVVIADSLEALLGVENIDEL